LGYHNLLIRGLFVPGDRLFEARLIAF
jgi:hypothetical protein